MSLGLALRIGIVALLALPFVGTAGAAQRADTVTFTLSQYRNVNGVIVLVFSGTVSSPAGGDEVEVVGQDCGGRGFRLISGTKTRAGGGWQVENPSTNPPRWTPVGSGMTFRARWRDQLSEPVTWRLPAHVWARKKPGRRVWEVHVQPESSGVSLAGKVVELQRRVPARWVRYQRAQLVHNASLDLGPYNHEAVFTVPTRGLRLRGFLPSASALPCYRSAATDPWRS